MGLNPRWCNTLLRRASQADAQQFFSFTPEAVGIKNWPELVAQYLAERQARSGSISRRRRQSCVAAH
jgi:hypothetical protein